MFSLKTKMDLKNQIDPNKLPVHVAVIMDGNGRWAQQRGKERVFGHQNAIDAVRATIEAAAEVGVRYLTLYAFSTENWDRPKNEVDTLMELLVNAIRNETEALNKNGVQLRAIGDLKSLPDECYASLMEAIELTKHNTKLTVIISLSYSSRWELTKAMTQIAQKVKNGLIEPEEITQQSIIDELETAIYPDPDLLIRTSGEMRISNFLLWQIAYAELYFTPLLWPDFRKDHFYEALLDFQKRNRRFGKV